MTKIITEDNDWGYITFPPARVLACTFSFSNRRCVVFILAISENDFNLTQIVTEPTRQGNIFDLLFTSHQDLVDKVYIVPGMSDHDAVICDINLRANPPANPKWNVYLYKRADMEGLRRKLKERFELFEASRPETKSIRANWDQFKADIYNSINEFIPQRTLKNKRSPPWCNANIRRLIRKKQRCYNPARRNGKEQVWRRFRHLRKLVHKELQLAHQQYVNSLLDIDEADPIHDHAKAGIIKLFWQYIKAKRRDSAGIAILKSHGKEFTKPKKKADILNEQYDSVFTLEDPVLPQLPDSPYPDMPNIHIDNNGVIKLLSGLNPSQAKGPDLLPTRVLPEFYLPTIHQHWWGATGLEACQCYSNI